MSDYYDIEPGDIGKRHLNAFGTSWRVLHIPGLGVVINAEDVGRRIHEIETIGGDRMLQVETTADRDARLADPTDWLDNPEPPL